MMQKKLLVLAAGILQKPIIKRAHEMGYYVIAADGNPHACGFNDADKAVCANITDEQVMLNIAKTENIDGVIHPCSEVSMSVMGRINDELNLSGVTYEQAIKSTNKHLMRKAFEDYGAPSPISFCYDSREKAWRCFCNKMPKDAILKPSRNSGSRGIAKITKGISEEEFNGLFDRAKDESRDNSVMLEQFIEGPEFSVEIIIWNSNINVLTVTDKKTTGAPYFVELGHNQPSVYKDDIVDQIKEAAVLGVRALGVNNCACHAEIKYENGKAYIMEIGARMGGDFISTVLTELSTGIDMIAAAINCALGIEPNLKPEMQPQGVCIRYFCPKPGRLFAIKNIDILDNPHVYSWEMYHSSGDIISEVTNSLNRSGHVIVTGQDAQEAIKLADSIISSIKFITQ